MLKNDHFFAVSARDGSMKPGEFAGDGLWSGDTRILSTLRVLVDGVEPTAVGLQADDGSATFELEGAGVHVQRVRFVDEGLHERITVANRGSTNVDVTLDVEVAADFAAMLGIRGAVPELASPVPVPAVAAVDGIRFVRDGHLTRVITQPHGLKHQLRLEPGEEFVLTLDVVPGSAQVTLDFDSGLRAARDIYPRWAAECMSVRTDNPVLNELLDQAIADIRMLSNSYDTGIYPTAGLPWFAVPFGRDTLISSTLLLHVNPEIARGVLRYLAKHQGKRVDESSEEQPGKILHEVRTGEVVERGLWPHILYGTIDATALFLCALTETEDWTHDHRFADELWPAAEAALAWCGTYGDPDGDGYLDADGGRARNQGWKDSDDPLTNTDGGEVARPAALGFEGARRGAQATFQPRLLDREGEVHRPGPRQLEASGASDHLESRALPLDADPRPPQGGACGEPALVPRAFFRLGHPHAVRPRGQLRPVQLPQRLRLAVRHCARRRRDAAVRFRQGGRAHRAG
ncbi:MAG: hypothetical protein E6I82_06470, partial [Chloroflexi bacterium]